MVTNAMLPKQFRMKFLSQFRKIVIGTRREIHYIGGSEVLPAPLEMEEESAVIKELATEYNEKAKKVLIEHNLRLVVYIAKNLIIRELGGRSDLNWHDWSDQSHQYL